MKGIGDNRSWNGVCLVCGVKLLSCCVLSIGFCLVFWAFAQAESATPAAPLIKLSLEDEKSKSPVYIKANTLTLETKKRVFIYQGGVEIWQDDLLVTGERMTGNYDESNRIQTITCEKNVVITRADTLRASAQRATYRLAEGTIELTEGPELLNKGNALTADKIVLYLNEDRSEAEGNVRVKVIRANEKEEGATGENQVDELKKLLE